LLNSSKPVVLRSRRPMLKTCRASLAGKRS
jgi:hypothetical protein